MFSTSELPSELAKKVSAAASGSAVIAGALDALVAEYDLDDAVVVVDTDDSGRRIFCAGGRPLTPADRDLLAVGPGLYTRPVLEDRSLDRTMLLSLCALALRLDSLRYDAEHDPLTGLYDRRSFDRLLDIAISRTTRYGWSFTLVLLDLDHFKLLNDREGHPAGDASLRELGARFRRALRVGDTAARIGGDEFAMILPNTAPAIVPVLLDRVKRAPGFVHECPSFSFGVAACPVDATRSDELVRIADVRLYEAKART